MRINIQPVNTLISNNPTKKQLRIPQLLFCGPAWA